MIAWPRVSGEAGFGHFLWAATYFDMATLSQVGQTSLCISFYNNNLDMYLGVVDIIVTKIGTDVESD